jgi:curved DNA-binding protein CbpA
VNAKRLNQLPQPVGAVDLRTLPIDPEAAFVLSRVDGRTNLADIAAATGLDTRRVEAALEQLISVGAVRFEPDVEDGIKPEQVELSPERQALIDETFKRLETLSHYELLDVGPDADARAVKHRYYEVVNVFHPDRYYGKQLGGYKQKLERVFSRLTEAHDVLTAANARAEYDRYLAAQARTRDLDAFRAARPAIPPAPAAAPAAPASSDSARAGADAGARKRALARRLRSGVMSRRPSGEVDRPPISNEARELLAEQMKRRVEAHKSSLQPRSTDHYLAAAKQAELENNPVATVNALRLAHSIEPARPGLAERLAAAELRASAALAGSYLEQARYEERTGHLGRAATSYEKAARGRQSARLYERAAHCELEAGGDLKHARQNAKAAISMAPGVAEYHVTLARVLLRAGMRQSALAEFERAAEIAPDNAAVKDWLARAKRGEG